MFEDKILVEITVTKPDGGVDGYRLYVYEMSWDALKEVIELIKILEGMEG